MPFSNANSNPSGSSWPVTLSLQFYRLLLKMYPAHFRQEYARQMAQVFRDCCREIYAQGGIKALLKLWPGILTDLFTTALKQHCANFSLRQVLAIIITYLIALGFAIFTGYVNVHNNEVQAPAGLLLIFSFSFGLARPQAAWRWALLFGLAIPLSYWVSHLIGYTPTSRPVPNEISTTFVLIPALVATYSGVLIRWLLKAALTS